MITDRLVLLTSRLLERRTDRRGFLWRTAVVGSAVTVSGADYVLRPGTAYASVCGPSASCSSGWTAMCCTINNGVNQCPPHSFAGGWWKADGASLCGGHARYYVDCQAKCTHCGCGGGAYCSQHCWNCKPHCPKGKSCDNRRVCHNLFRYGQCRHDIGCSGPVLCRAISCTPPWKWEQCSTASATDNYTRAHSSDCLSKWTPIAKRYTRMGSQGSLLGATVHGEYDVHRGRLQRYEHGRMYWSKRTDAHWLTSHILDRYKHVGETASPLGLPTSDAHDTDGGRGATFEHGGIYKKNEWQPHALWGPIWERWLEHHKYRGPLGYPTSDVKDGDKPGKKATFEHGAIYHRRVTGTFALWGPVHQKYRHVGTEGGVLGYPLSEVVDVANAEDVPGLGALFAHGAIAGAGTDVHAVWGPIYQAWRKRGGIQSDIGYPVSDIVDTPTEQHCQFEHGLATYDKATGTVTVTPV